MKYWNEIDGTSILCPYCNERHVIKYGRRGGNQLFYCNDCKKKFIKKPLKNKTYSPKVITSAISHYNLGYTLEDAAKLVNRQFKVNVSKSSLHSWIKEFAEICTYRKLRAKVVKKYGEKIICEHSFKHSGLTYNFTYHLPKVEILCSQYPSLINYLTDMHKRCPSDVFREGERCSQLLFDVRIKKDGFYNQACKLAELALTACTTNTQRHGIVERFMLINDSSTIACEIPVWFWEKNLGSSVCGHIDILQMRRGNIYVLDFKPMAEKVNEEKVASQLYQYAIGLSFRTSIPLKMMRCAWFDENVYYEFNPMNAKLKIIRR